MHAGRIHTHSNGPLPSWKIAETALAIKSIKTHTQYKHMKWDKATFSWLLFCDSWRFVAMVLVTTSHIYIYTYTTSDDAPWKGLQGIHARLAGFVREPLSSGHDKFEIMFRTTSAITQKRPHTQKDIKNTCNQRHQ